MNLFSILSFSICSSSDSFIIGLNYGIKKIKINLILNIFVALISSLGTFLSMYFGKVLEGFLPNKLSKYLGPVMLILFGLYMLYNSMNKYRVDKTIKRKKSAYLELINNPEIIDINSSNSIDFKEAIFLGIFLSINNIGIGIGASISGINIILTTAFSFVFCFIFLKFGYLVGKLLNHNKLSNVIELFASMIIILLGILNL